MQRFQLLREAKNQYWLCCWQERLGIIRLLDKMSMSFINFRDMQTNKSSKNRLALKLRFKLKRRSKSFFGFETGWVILLPDRMKAEFTTCTYPLLYLSLSMWLVCCSLPGILHTASQWLISQSIETISTYCLKAQNFINKVGKKDHTYTHTHNHLVYRQGGKKQQQQRAPPALP